MNCNQRLINLLNHKAVDRPPFLPAIYDLKPSLINAPQHSFGQQKEELLKALAFEAEVLQMEALTVGYDIYNVEAEAIGCKISRNSGKGVPEIAAPLLRSIEEIHQLEKIKTPVARMPLFIETTYEAQRLFGERLPVRAGISGPFSMAAKIYPHNELLTDCIINPEAVIKLLNFCTDIILVYLKALIKTGAGIIIFDSFVAPPMISPEIYRDLVFPFHKKLFAFLQNNNVLQRTLIVGGSTAPLIPDFIRTGTTQLLLDFSISTHKAKEIMNEFNKMVFRVNIPPSLFISENTIELKNYIINLLKNLKDCRNLILGTGILSPNVPPLNLVFAKKTIENFYR